MNTDTESNKQISPMVSRIMTTDGNLIFVVVNSKSNSELNKRQVFCLRHLYLQGGSKSGPTDKVLTAQT